MHGLRLYILYDAATYYVPHVTDDSAGNWVHKTTTLVEIYAKISRHALALISNHFYKSMNLQRYCLRNE